MVCIHCSVLVGHRNGLERDFINQIKITLGPYDILISKQNNLVKLVPLVKYSRNQNYPTRNK